MKVALALSLLFFTSSALAAVVGKDVSYKAGDTVMNRIVGSNRIAGSELRGQAFTLYLRFNLASAVGWAERFL